MKKVSPPVFLSLFALIVFSLQGCSWVCRFYITNTTNETLSVEMKLMDCPGSFPIFHYPHFYYGKLWQYQLKKNSNVNHFAGMIEVKADTLENFSHFRFQIPPHSAVEIGALQNDKYERHDQQFINGRKFNLERLLIMEKKIEVTPADFDNHFRKGKSGEIYFVI